MIEWISCEDKLPPSDGLYAVRNHEKDEGGVAEYDGYGFIYDNVYRNPKYWGKIPNIEKKYGVQ